MPPRVFVLLGVVLPAAAMATAVWPGGDMKVSPGQDFYTFANGSWQHDTVIPPDRAGFSTATKLIVDTENKLRELLQNTAALAGAPEGEESAKVVAYYSAFMDERRIEELGPRPLAPLLARIKEAGDRTALARLMGSANAGFNFSIFALAVEPDSHAPERYAVTLSQDGLGLPDPKDYLDPASLGRREAYESYVARLLKLAGWSDAAGAARHVLTVETEMARASWTGAQQRDEARNYHPVSQSDLVRIAPGFPWAAYWSAAGIQTDRIVLTEDEAVGSLARLYTATPIGDLRAWAAFHLVDNAAPYLSGSFRAAWFDFHGRQLAGTSQEPPRWRQAVRLVSGGGSKDLADSRGAMGDAVGRMYVARWFDSRSEARLRALSDELKSTLRARIKLSSWMSETAKTEALRKVDAYRIEIGAPAHGDHYDGLIIRRDDLIGDVERVTAYAWQRDRGRLGHAVDRAEWTITPQTVNAYNYAPLTVVVFTAALLQPPAFDPVEDPAFVYGGIGAIIGHELTHAFDDVGRTFDHTGHHRNWWTPSDATHFEAMSDQLVRQFAACEALPGLHVDGRLTLGENIADIGGLQLAFDAYHSSLNNQPAPLVDGLSGDQRFFLGFALLRRDKRRPEAIRTEVATDPHTPDTCRVNQVVRNVDGWYQGFKINPFDKLYLAPDQRTRFW